MYKHKQKSLYHIWKIFKYTKFEALSLQEAIQLTNTKFDSLVALVTESGIYFESNFTILSI